MQIPPFYNKKWKMDDVNEKPETADAEVSVDQDFYFLSWQQAQTVFPFLSKSLS